MFAVVSAPLFAATPPPETRIAITGKGSVSRPAEIADLRMSVVGVGKSPEEATDAMADVQSGVEVALTKFGLSANDIHTSGLLVQAVRAGDCEDETQTTGKCAIIGHRSAQQLKAQLHSPELAGDAIAAAAKAGATDAAIISMRLKEPAAARQEASALAIADARARASRTAHASGMKLGPMLTLRDSNAYDSFSDGDFELLPNELPIPTGREISPSIVVTADRRVSVRPEPITTTVIVTTTFALRP